ANSVAKRRAEKTAEIVASAWAAARADGIAGVTLHGLARVAGMRQPSLYVYNDPGGDRWLRHLSRLADLLAGDDIARGGPGER
ncbi:MAG: hypothetical protein ACRDOL_44820, partial [Streptosporangiaceae bacterium]